MTEAMMWSNSHGLMVSAVTGLVRAGHEHAQSYLNTGYCLRIYRQKSATEAVQISEKKIK